MLRSIFITVAVLIAVFLALVHFQYLMLRCRVCQAHVVRSLHVYDGDCRGPLRILSYNLHGLPLFWKNNAERVKVLTSAFLEDRLNDHDVMAFQEAFSSEYTRDLSTFLSSRGWHVAHPRPASFPHFAHSGLMLASRHEMMGVECITFDTCALLDCFATKGALSATIQRDGESITIVNTHLQDATWDATGNTRTRQIKLLRDHWGQNTTSSPVYVGDFNLHTDASKACGAEMLGKATFPTSGTYGNTVLDGAFGPRVCSVHVLRPQYPCFVSDHLPISITLCP